MVYLKEYNIIVISHGLDYKLKGYNLVNFYGFQYLHKKLNVV